MQIQLCSQTSQKLSQWCYIFPDYLLIWQWVVWGATLEEMPSLHSSERRTCKDSFHLSPLGLCSVLSSCCLHMCVLKALYQELVTTIRTVKQSLHRKSIFLVLDLESLVLSYSRMLTGWMFWQAVIKSVWERRMSKHLHITGTMCTSEFELLLHLVWGNDCSQELISWDITIETF